MFIVDPIRANIKPLLPFLVSNEWKKLIHNAIFEQRFMQYHYQTPIRNLFDTMIAESVITSDKYSRGLDYVVEKYTGRKLDKRLQKSFINMKPMSIFTDEQLQYASTDVEVLFPVYEAQRNSLAEESLLPIAELEFAVTESVAAMENEGIPIIRSKWEGIINDYQQKYEDSRQRMNDLIFDDPNSTMTEQMGLFTRDGINLRSPQQVKAAFNNIGIDVDSTDKRTITKENHPAAKELTNNRQIVKTLDTYGYSFLEKVHPFTGRFHPDFYQMGTETGRFSCREPNAQNIPEEFRECVGGVQDYKIVGADYSQIELRIIAELSDDPSLIKAFATGDDPHKSTAAFMFNIPFDTVTKDQRYIAKTINFGLSYGMGAGKLFDMLNEGKVGRDRLTMGKVYDIINQYKATYSKVVEWFDAAGQIAYSRGYSETIGGRKRYFRRPEPGIDSESFKNQVAALRRAGGNAPIQGTSADITKTALDMAYHELKAYGYRANPINVIHDELLLIAHKSQAEDVKLIVEQAMIDAAQKFMTKVPVKVDAYVSDIWKK